ncbi:cell division protein FtsK [Bacillus sp. VT 712]|uniref:Cell division protein FtsK n=1 Tax=Priestia veravalensis TaxID=1414648 RepID=A0A0V8JS04_9BACI|nr:MULTISPECIES: DNA translocase FtsK [Bacillaceae]KSU89871.1 cell division protein FtsK [Priestia veravalensis]KZB93213.1 cell division protein FtsK [Bacillus sp. VT 712]WEZ09949.1 DNA translocase FtsK [Priestia flexa]SCB75605.1 DNA segregation ATPase FtsK/SpoIIIE, S-DNA-T family [Priestia flexa]
MAKKKRRGKFKKEEWKRIVRFELIGLLLLAITLIAMAGLGAVGQALVLLVRLFIGEWYMLMLIGLLVLSGYIIWKRALPPFITRQLVGTYLIILAILLFSHVTLFENLSKNGTFTDPSVILNTWDLYMLEATGEVNRSDLGGGMVGAVMFAMFYYLFDSLGTELIASLLIVIGVLLITGRSLHETLRKVLTPIVRFLVTELKEGWEDITNWASKKKQTSKGKKKRKPAVEEEEESDEQEVEAPVIAKQPPIIEHFDYEEEADSLPASVQAQPEPQPQPTVKPVQPVEKKESPAQQEEKAPVISFVEAENMEYELPPIRLLTMPKKSNQAKEKKNIYKNAEKLEKTFQSFGVKATVAKVHLGPAVTKYEVYPDVGVKVSKIVNLSDDLALALAAKDIRIEAPIPGKSAVGIEVPNEEVAMVSLREVLESKDKMDPDKKLLVGLGRDISGDAVLAELNKMPHMLVAGATGSGKSVCINGIIISILMRTKPHEVKLMMIDPKMVELNMYNGIPHLLAPVVTDPKKASQALKKVVSEMERRYELFSHSGTRNIEGYNDLVKRHNDDSDAKQPTLPYIVVIVDELADLMMVASSDVEDSITRLAQMARAAGIHLIIATQRPSVDVITGVIKANIPSRIAFSVSSQTDSRTILDMGGAEKLLGRGDMLFMPVGASKPVRVQGAFLSDEEVEEVVDFVIAQQKAQYQEEMIPTDAPEQVEEVADELYDEAVQLVAEMQTASVSMLQRRFRIGYNRAARLIDAMEERGVVGPYEGSKPRAVLVSQQNEDVGT